MKRIFGWTLMILLLSSWLVFDYSSAQKKRTGRSTRTAKPAPTPVPDMRAEATKVAEQVNNISKFLYVYGKIANGLEIAEDQAKRKLVTPAVAEQNNKNKDALIAHINGLKTGLNALVANFKANPRMQVQYLKLSYAGDAVATAEQLASAGRYDEAGKSLTLAIERLNETILSMRLI